MFKSISTFKYINLLTFIDIFEAEKEIKLSLYLFMQKKYPTWVELYCDHFIELALEIFLERFNQRPGFNFISVAGKVVKLFKLLN